MYYPTDFGSCCLLVPHLHFQPRPANKTNDELYHKLEADAKNGGKNGLEIIVDAEQFNHAQYSQTKGAGFLISLHHHLDKPMMKFSSKLIYTGTATMINLRPTISYTTNEYHQQIICDVH